MINKNYLPTDKDIYLFIIIIYEKYDGPVSNLSCISF